MVPASVKPGAGGRASGVHVDGTTEDVDASIATAAGAPDAEDSPPALLPDGYLLAGRYLIQARAWQT
jgi:hypothetical protein